MSARILIVDDEEIVIRSCRRILAGDDFTIDSVQSGQEALKMLDEGDYVITVVQPTPTP